jgi:hypothetical protein
MKIIWKCKSCKVENDIDSKTCKDCKLVLTKDEFLKIKSGFGFWDCNCGTIKNFIIKDKCRGCKKPRMESEKKKEKKVKVEHNQEKKKEKTTKEDKGEKTIQKEKTNEKKEKTKEKEEKKIQKKERKVAKWECHCGEKNVFSLKKCKACDEEMDKTKNFNDKMKEGLGMYALQL